MKKMTTTEARSTNGGCYKIYQCKNCGWQIMVGWTEWLLGYTKYASKPYYCPHCWADHCWKQV